MYLKIEGWSRVTSHGTRNLLPIDIQQSRENDSGNYPGGGSFIQYTSEGVCIRYRLEVNPTMGGDYKAELFISAFDLATLFMKVFRHQTLDKVLQALRQNRA